MEIKTIENRAADDLKIVRISEVPQLFNKKCKSSMA